MERALTYDCLCVKTYTLLESKEMTKQQPTLRSFFTKSSGVGKKSKGERGKKASSISSKLNTSRSPVLLPPTCTQEVPSNSCDAVKDEQSRSISIPAGDDSRSEFFYECFVFFHRHNIFSIIDVGLSPHDLSLLTLLKYQTSFLAIERDSSVEQKVYVAVGVVDCAEEEDEQNILPPITPQASAKVLVTASPRPSNCDSKLVAALNSKVMPEKPAANKVVSPLIRSKKAKKRAKILSTLPFAAVSSPPIAAVVESIAESNVSQDPSKDSVGSHTMLKDSSSSSMEKTNVVPELSLKDADEIHKCREMAKDLIARANAIDLCLDEDTSEVVGAPLEGDHHSFPEVLRPKLAAIVFGR